MMCFIFMTKALALTPASVLAPFQYTQLLWVSILGFLVFGELPDIWTVVGAAFIVASGLYTAHRERVRRSQLLALPGPAQAQGATLAATRAASDAVLSSMIFASV